MTFGSGSKRTNRTRESRMNIRNLALAAGASLLALSATLVQAQQTAAARAIDAYVGTWSYSAEYSGYAPQFGVVEVTSSGQCRGRIGSKDFTPFAPCSVDSNGELTITTQNSRGYPMTITLRHVNGQATGAALVSGQYHMPLKDLRKS